MIILLLAIFVIVGLGVLFIIANLLAPVNGDYDDGDDWRIP